MATGFYNSFNYNFYHNFYHDFYHNFYWTPISTRGCYHKVGQAEMEDVLVEFGPVGVQDARFGADCASYSIQNRSQIPIGEDYIAELCPQDA